MSQLFPNAGTDAHTPKTAPRAYRDLIDQGKWWKGAEGWIKIKKMHPAHRANAAALLLRNAADVEERYSMSMFRELIGAPDEVVDEFLTRDDKRAESPRKWLRGTKIFRSLTRDQRKIDAIVDDAR